MKLHKIRCHFQEVSHRRERGDRRDRRDYLFFFNCLRTSSAHSAVNYYVSFSIKLTVLLPGGRAQTLCSLQPNR